MTLPSNFTKHYLSFNSEFILQGVWKYSFHSKDIRSQSWFSGLLKWFRSPSIVIIAKPQAYLACLTFQTNAGTQCGYADSWLLFETSSSLRLASCLAVSCQHGKWPFLRFLLFGRCCRNTKRKSSCSRDRADIGRNGRRSCVCWIYCSTPTLWSVKVEVCVFYAASVNKRNCKNNTSINVSCPLLVEGTDSPSPDLVDAVLLCRPTWSHSETYL